MKVFSIFFIFLLIVSIAIMGCSKETSVGSAVDVLDKNSKVVNAGEWCVPGSEWGLDFEREGLEPGEVFVKGVEVTGEYKGLCNVKYKGSFDSVEYWFNKDGKTGYYQVGVFVREWSS
ncbi:MAG: hypothetical protein U9R08_06790 [Nanoarchaeota archaeon]|nr:hypothetical protein [Nanoarchaeota archaeon]